MQSDRCTVLNIAEYGRVLGADMQSSDKNKTRLKIQKNLKNEECNSYNTYGESHTKQKNLCLIIYFSSKIFLELH